MPDKAEHVFARDNALRALSYRLEKIFGRGPARRGLLLDLSYWKERVESLPMMTTTPQQFFVLEVELDQFAGALDPVLAEKVK